MDCKRIRNEEKSMRSDEEVIRHINEIIDRQIQPSVELHGGKVSLEKYEDGIATMFMSGACSGCASSEYTLQQGILQMLQYYIPEEECLESRRPKLYCRPILHLTNTPLYGTIIV